MNSWANWEIQYLRDTYKTLTANDISVVLGKSYWAIVKKKNYLGLTLNKEERSRRTKMCNMSGNRNPNWKGGISKNNYHYKKIQKNRYSDRVKARQDVSNALRSGRLKKCSCIMCGDSNVQAHHEDYNKPLDVIWLCPKHHRARHTE